MNWLKQLKEIWSAGKEALDTNKDGIVSKEELLSPQALKLILVTLLSLLAPKVISWLTQSIAEGHLFIIAFLTCILKQEQYAILLVF